MKTTTGQHNAYQARRYDIDWLRTLAFIILIYYHIGMYYVAQWDWHVKSQYQSESLQYLMLLVNQWRMPLIFFIAGLVLAMVEPRMSARQLLKRRFLRVFVPLVIGMYLIVPPQVFFEATANLGYAGGYWEFWQHYIQPHTKLLPEMRQSDLGLLTWNHLWFLMYLWVYTLVYLVIQPIMVRIGAGLERRAPSEFVLFCAPIIILTAVGLWLKPLYPKTNALFDDWYNHGIYFSVFLFGYFTAKSERIWQTIISCRRFWVASAVLNYISLMVIVKTDWISFNGDVWDACVQVGVYTNMWSWLLAAVGYSGAYLNRSSPMLSYLNEAILPWYILHQTVTIIIAMTLAPMSLGGFYEPALLIVGTFAVCAALYWFIQHWNILRFIFGMKLKQRVRAHKNK